MKTNKPMFLQNVGVELQPYRSSMSTLAEELEIEKMGSADLRSIINTQRHEMDTLTSDIHQSEEKHAYLVKKMEALTRLFDLQR